MTELDIMTELNARIALLHDCVRERIKKAAPLLLEQIPPAATDPRQQDRLMAWLETRHDEQLKRLFTEMEVLSRIAEGSIEERFIAPAVPI
jgi:hypothetical protein